MELETKAFGSEGHDTLEVKKAFEDFLAGFEAFKQSNDERLKGLEKRSADVLLDEKVDRINKALEGQQRHLDGLMLDAARPFMESVTLTIPWLKARSVGGAIMTIGHLVFAWHFAAMALRHGPRRVGAALLHTRSSAPAPSSNLAGA